MDTPAQQPQPENAGFSLGSTASHRVEKEANKKRRDIESKRMQTYNVGGSKDELQKGREDYSVQLRKSKR